MQIATEKPHDPTVFCLFVFLFFFCPEIMLACCFLWLTKNKQWSTCCLYHPVPRSIGVTGVSTLRHFCSRESVIPFWSNSCLLNRTWASMRCGQPLCVCPKKPGILTSLGVWKKGRALCGWSKALLAISDGCFHGTVTRHSLGSATWGAKTLPIV